MPALTPIRGVVRFGVSGDEHPGNGYLSSGPSANSELHGAGHMGVAPLDRIIMSLQSGIETEIEYALSTLTYYSCNEPKVLDFAAYPLIGDELIGYFIRPYHLYLEGRAAQVLQAILSISVEALLSLRNAVQDLHNQQWLSQVPSFRRHAADALKFLVHWFYPQPKNLYSLEKRSGLLRESLAYLLDILDPLTCFYVENQKSDPLLHPLLTVLLATNDKYTLVVVTKCLTHLLYLGGPGAVTPRNSDEPNFNNCIDAIQLEHLAVVVRSLLVNDDEMTYHALCFIKQYLLSEALHLQYKSLTKNSQLHRLRKLAEAAGSKANLEILLKQLPEFLIANLPLVDPLKLQLSHPLQLTKRSAYGGVPVATSKLPQKLYDIIINFPEPLRATTWLRCCYEPYTLTVKSSSDSSELAAGEVTQISLWKSYENQFEAIWKDKASSAWPNLLPAVDFIKNVSSAFPNSEAMVVNIPGGETSQPGRKKFIIKGIQPRQFPVSIDIGNYEALRKNATKTEEKNEAATQVGDVDKREFEKSVEALTDSILSASDGLTGPDDQNAPWYSPINGVAKDILEIIVDGLLEPDTNGEYKNLFRLYNKDWLPDLIYANPALIDLGYFDGKWMLYIL